MNVLIIGAGNMGRGIATRLARSASTLILHDVDAAKAEALAADITGSQPETRVQVTASPAAAVSTSDIVILACSYAINLETARSLGTALTGMIVVDISNPLNDSYDDLVTAPGTSAAETIRDVIPADATLLKAFNTTFASTLATGAVAGQPLDVFIAGDNDAAKTTFTQLLRRAGLTPIDAGALLRARQLKALGLLGITLQSRLGTGFATAWRLVLPVAA